MDTKEVTAEELFSIAKDVHQKKEIKHRLMDMEVLKILYFVLSAEASQGKLEYTTSNFLSETVLSELQSRGFF